MVTLTTEYGEFAADTEELALSAARKAKREAAKLEKQRAANFETARERAKANAYYVYVAAHGSMPHTLLVPPNKPCGPKLQVMDDSKTQAFFETSDGVARLIYWHKERTVIGGIIDGAGFTIGYIVEETDHSAEQTRSKTKLYWVNGIGVCNGETAAVDCPGLTPDKFLEQP